jgi:hypothetical protein
MVQKDVLIKLDYCIFFLSDFHHLVKLDKCVQVNFQDGTYINVTSDNNDIDKVFDKYVENIDNALILYNS